MWDRQPVHSLLTQLIPRAQRPLTRKRQLSEHQNHTKLRALQPLSSRNSPTKANELLWDSVVAVARLQNRERIAQAGCQKTQDIVAAAAVAQS